MRQLWVKTIEAHMYRCEYSLLVASDGPGGETDATIRTANTGWVNVKPGINRRMGAEHTINLWYKYLNNDNHGWIDWNFKGLLPIPSKTNV